MWLTTASPCRLLLATAPSACYPSKVRILLELVGDEHTVLGARYGIAGVWPQGAVLCFVYYLHKVEHIERFAYTHVSCLLASQCGMLPGVIEVVGVQMLHRWMCMGLTVCGWSSGGSASWALVARTIGAHYWDKQRRLWLLLLLSGHLLHCQQHMTRCPQQRKTLALGTLALHMNSRGFDWRLGV